jgi:hypothetical protein
MSLSHMRVIWLSFGLPCCLLIGSLPLAAADDSANDPVIKGEDLLNPFASRTSKQVQANVALYGGTTESEAAVARGLEWLAKKQAADGSWSFEGNLQEAKNTATGLALLPFLGAGHTHQNGKYRKTVDAGIKYLVQHLKETDAGGSLIDRGTMYGQGISTTALCEAFGLTKDPMLKKPAQQAITFIVNAQDPVGGGWRYSPKMPGDTSITGWQIAALKTAQAAGLEVPATVFPAASGYLDKVQTPDGAHYGYVAPANGPGTTASGLLSRFYLGWDAKKPTVDKSLDALSTLGPSATNLYFDYFATQAMFHSGGNAWDKWNNVSRNMLVESQAKEGNNAGSWAANKDNFGGQMAGPLYTTSLSLLILEVYYRHPPLARR